MEKTDELLKKILDAQLVQVALLQAIQATLTTQVPTADRRVVDWDATGKLLDDASTVAQSTGTSLDTWAKLSKP